MLPSAPEQLGSGTGRFRRAVVPSPLSDVGDAADGQDRILPTGAGESDGGSSVSMEELQAPQGVSDAAGVSKMSELGSLSMWNLWCQGYYRHQIQWYFS